MFNCEIESQGSVQLKHTSNNATASTKIFY